MVGRSVPACAADAMPVPMSFVEEKFTLNEGMNE